MPMEEKLKIKVNEHTIGYMPIAEKAPPNAAAQGKKPSQNEAFFLRRERDADDPDVIAGRRFHAQNQWPANLPGFREQTLAVHEHDGGAVPQAGAALCAGARPAGRPLRRLLREPHMILRQSRYPQIDGADDTVASLVPHTDSGFMTLLPPNKVQGLSIHCRTANGRRAHVEDAFVVNGGDILHRWTNERFLSTPHRVRNVSGTLRYAIPFFCDPDHDTIDRVPAVVPVGRQPAEVSADQVRRLRAVVRRPALPAHGQGGDAVRADEVAPGARATVRLEELSSDRPSSGALQISGAPLGAPARLS